jgi:hypothetical protein
MKNEDRCAERTVGELSHMDEREKVEPVEVLKVKSEE